MNAQFYTDVIIPSHDACIFNKSFRKDGNMVFTSSWQRGKKHCIAMISSVAVPPDKAVNEPVLFNLEVHLQQGNDQMNSGRMPQLLCRKTPACAIKADVQV
jgi:hypothetical protein